VAEGAKKKAKSAKPPNRACTGPIEAFISLCMKPTSTRRTVKVAILAFKTFASIPITGPMDILNKSCALIRSILEAGSINFQIELVALSKSPLRFGDCVTVYPHASIATAKRPDLVLIPSAGDNVLESLESLRAFVPWIKVCAGRGARIVSMYGRFSIGGNRTS